MYLYKITNVISNSIYIGITKNNVEKRFKNHKYSAKRGLKTKLYDAIRSYGIENFKIEVLQEYDTWKELVIQEIESIKLHKKLGYNLYNMKDELQPIFYIKDMEAHKANLRLKRVGRKPALGMKHSDDNKKLFSELSIQYWATQEKYNPEEVLKLGFTKSNKKYGISKTHYYRLRKQVLTNEQC